MKIDTFFISVFFLAVASCGNSGKDYYEGYVYYNNIPLGGVIVKEVIDGNSSSVQTTENGYFKLTKCFGNFTPDLIFSRHGFKTDTIVVTRGMHSGQIYTLFCRDESDTLRMKKQ